MKRLLPVLLTLCLIITFLINSVSVYAADYIYYATIYVNTSSVSYSMGCLSTINDPKFFVFQEGSYYYMGGFYNVNGTYKALSTTRLKDGTGSSWDGGSYARIGQDAYDYGKIKFYSISSSYYTGVSDDTNYVTVNNTLLTYSGIFLAIAKELNGISQTDVTLPSQIPIFTGENSIWNNGEKLIKGFNTKSELNSANGDFTFTLDFDDDFSDGSIPDSASSYYQYAFAGYDEDSDSLSIWDILTNPTKAINFVLKHHDGNGYLEIDTTGGGGHSFGPSDGFNWKKYIPKILTRRIYWNEEEQVYQNTNWYEVTINDNSIGTQVVQNISQTIVNDITYNQNLYNTTTQSYYYDYSVGQVINNYSEKITTNNYYTENVYTYTTVYNTNNNQTYNDAHNVTYNSVLVTPDLDFGDLFGDDSSGFDWSSISIEKIIKAIGTLLSGLLVMIPMMFELLGFLPSWAVAFMVTGVTIMISLAVVYLILRGIKN